MNAPLQWTVAILGDADFLAFATKQGWQLFKGVSGAESVDYIALTPKGLKRVEVKRLSTLQTKHRMRSHGLSLGSYAASVTHKNFDLLFISTPIGCYLIPPKIIPESGRVTITVNRSKYHKYLIPPE